MMAAVLALERFHVHQLILMPLSCRWLWYLGVRFCHGLRTAPAVPRVAVRDTGLIRATSAGQDGVALGSLGLAGEAGKEDLGCPAELEPHRPMGLRSEPVSCCRSF